MSKQLEVPQIDRVMNQAQEGFLQYRQVTGASRAQFLEAIAVEIETLGVSLIRHAM